MIQLYLSPQPFHRVERLLVRGNGFGGIAGIFLQPGNTEQSPPAHFTQQQGIGYFKGFTVTRFGGSGLVHCRLGITSGEINLGKIDLVANFQSHDGGLGELLQGRCCIPHFQAGLTEIAQVVGHRPTGAELAINDKRFFERFQRLGVFP